MTERIQLGDKVKSKYSGFIGIVVAKIIYINGCVQYAVVPKWDGKSPSQDDVWIDEQSLIVVKRFEEKDYNNNENGGASRVGIKMRGY